MKQRCRSTENNDVLLPPTWVRGSCASLLTSHVMTNSERLPPPPLTLAGVTFGAGGRRQIGLALLTSHDAKKAHVIVFNVATPRRQGEVIFTAYSNFNTQKSCKISANFSQLSCVHSLWCCLYQKTHKGFNLGKLSSLF